MFTRSGTTWTQQGSKLTGSGEVAVINGGDFGWSVALSADGNTALIGGRWDFGDVGAAWVFTVTAPAAPTGVSAVAGNGQASVSFTAPVGPVGSYTVTASPGGQTATGPSSPITVTGLTNGTAYTFTVTATNAGGTSPASAPSAAVTPAAVPGAPTAVTATAGDGQASVSFTAPASNGSAIGSYTVTSSPGGLTGTGGSSPVTVTGLTNGTSYTFTVTATNAVGTGPASAASNAVTYVAPAFVSAVSPATGSVAGGTVVTVTGGLFTGATGVLFGLVSAQSFSVVDDSTVVAVAPAGVVGPPVDVRVVAPGGTSDVGGGDAFVYVAPTPAAGVEVHPAPPGPVVRPVTPAPPLLPGGRKPPPGQP